MQLLKLLDEIDEIVDTSSNVIFTGKILVDREDLLTILKEVRLAIPEEIQQAKWIKDQRDSILDKAKEEYEILLNEGQKQADLLIEENAITKEAKRAADLYTSQAKDSVKKMRMDTYEYLDGQLLDFQNKMEELKASNFGEMFAYIQGTFENINDTVVRNRNEIRDLSYSAQMEDE